MQCHGFIKDIYVGTVFKEQNLRFEKWQIDRPFLNLEFIWGDGEGFIMMCESQKEFHIQKKFHYQVLPWWRKKASIMQMEVSSVVVDT